MAGRFGIPRRQVLAGLGAAGVVACGPGGTGPAARKPSKQERGKIDTIVFCMMENRSFDHVFGSLSLLEGRTEVDGLRPEHHNRAASGADLGPTPTTEMCTAGDPPHGWDSSRVQFGEGRCDGFVRAWEERHGPGWSPETPMTYLTRDQQPVSYALADGHALCQRWFSSLLTSTWPNRLYLHATQSQGIPANDFPPDGVYTCRTIWDQLTDAGVPWAYYFTDLPTIALWGRDDWEPNIHLMQDFFAHAEAGTLPPVVCVEPGAAFNDDHPPHHPMFGQMFLGSVYQALARSPQWERCLFLYTYDEAGGFFDHVPPGTAADDRAAEGFDQLGFRVPTVVTGPYVRNVVSDTAFDHAAVARFIQDHFGITERLTARNAAAADLSELLDADLLARGEAQPPVELPVFRQTEDEIRAECRKLQPRSGQPELHEAVKRIWPHLDRTPLVPKLAEEAWEQARRLGLWVPSR